MVFHDSGAMVGVGVAGVFSVPSGRGVLDLVTVAVDDEGAVTFEGTRVLIAVLVRIETGSGLVTPQAARDTINNKGI